MNNTSTKDHLEAVVVQLIQQLREFYDELERTHQQADKVSLYLPQAEKLSEVGLMVSTLVHDIANPLTVIIGEAQQLSMLSTNAPELVKSYQTIEQQGKRIAQLLQTVRTYIRKTTNEQQPLALHQIIDDSLSLVEELCSQSAITIIKRYCPADPRIAGNANQLEQVFINLFQNAAQAMPTGGMLTVATRLISEKVEVVVTDTGYGIPQEYVGRIFNPFFTTKLVGQGMGLGLAICKRIVEDHHGTIGVESQVGHGSHLIVTLPVM